MNDMNGMGGYGLNYLVNP